MISKTFLQYTVSRYESIVQSRGNKALQIVKLSFFVRLTIVYDFNDKLEWQKNIDKFSL